LYGIAAALTFPSWMAIFTRHMDHNREGIEWGMYYTMIDLSAACAATIGGFVAVKFGFIPLFMMVSILSFTGSSFLLLIKSKIVRV